MNKEFKGKGITDLEIKIEGNALVEFIESKDNSFLMEVEYQNKALTFKENLTNNSYKLKIENPENKELLKELVDLRTFKSFFEVIKHFSEKDSKNEQMIIKIKLPEELANFNFRLNNGILKFDYINSQKVNLKGNNLSIELRNNIKIDECNIKINNSNLNIDLNKELKSMNIKSNNGNIKFYRINGSDTGITFKGNQVVTEGELETNNNIVYCKMNKGSITVN